MAHLLVEAFILLFSVKRMDILPQRRGIRLDGELVRSLRKMYGWSQQLTAEYAGVSERTIRNAEKGHTLELHIAECIAGALNTTISKLSVEKTIVSDLRRLSHWIADFEEELSLSIQKKNFTAFCRRLHPEIEWILQMYSSTSFWRELSWP